MDLWIRSQDKETLVKTNLVAFKKFNDCYGIINYININDWFGLGSYKTKERALEVLDEIQNILRPTQLMINNGGAFVSNDNNLHIINPTYSKIEQLDPIIYEMPNE